MSILSSRSAKFCTRTLLLFLLLAGVVITAVRVFLPLVQDYRAELEMMIEEKLGRSINIGQIRAGLWGFHLEAVLKNVALLDPQSGNQQLHIRELHAQIDLIDSLMEQRLKLGKIMLVGTQLQLLLQSDGTVVLEGFEDSQQTDHDAAGALLFHESELLLQESEVYWRNQRINAPPLHFSDVYVTLVNRDGKHSLKATAQLGQKYQSRIELRAELTGNPVEPGGWGGEVYLQGRQVELEQLLAARRPQGTQIDQGSLDAKFWTRWENSQLVHVQGELDIKNLQLTTTNDEQVLHNVLERVKSAVNWQMTAGGWQLSLPTLTLTKAGVTWPPSSIIVDVNHDAEQRLGLHAQVKFLRLGDLLPVGMLFLPQDHEQVQLLSRLSPQADLQDFDLRLNETAPQAYDWRLTGRLNNLSTQSSGAIPAVSGLNLAFNATPQRGRANMASDDLTLRFNTLFRDPLHADLLNGRLDWQISPDEGLRLTTQEMALANADIKTVSRLDLQIPFDQRRPVIDMQSDFQEGNAATARRYLPTGIMHESLVKWLDRSIVNGRLSKGSMLLRGPLAAFPFKGNEGRFQVLFNAQKTLLDYMPEWPPIEQAQARVHFLNNSLDIQIRQAKLLQSRISKTRVQIHDLAGGSPVLIQGVLQGPSEDGLKILGDTPLSEQFGPLVETVKMTGQATVDLDFAIPLADKDHFRLQGGVVWHDAVLNLPAWDLSLTEVSGRLALSDQGVSAEGIKASVLGAKAAIEVSTVSSATGHATHIRAKLPIDSKRLAEKLPDIYLEQLQGASDVDLELRIGRQIKGQIPLTFTVKSDLEGIAVDAPPPFRKSNNEKRHFRLNGDLSNTEQIRLAFDYGDELDAILLVDGRKKRLLKGALHAGPGSAKLPQEAAFQFAGVVDKVDWGIWHEWLQGLEGRQQGGSALPLMMDLTIGELQWLGQKWRQVGLQGSDQAGALKILFSGQSLEGELQLYDDEGQQQQNRADLKQLHINLDFDTSAVTREKPPIEPTDDDPHDIPPIQVNVERLVVNEKPLGQLSFSLQSQPDGIDLRDFHLAGEQLNISGDGGWILKDGQHNSRLDIVLNCTDLGQLIEDLGFSSNIYGADVGSTMQLNWSLPVTQLRAEALNGYVEILASKGRFLDLDPGIGRLIGLLSISEIGRRLTFDFSDLVHEGFAFNTIAGSFRIENGDAYTDDMVIEGPAAKIEIIGRSGLASNDYDQMITVIPAVTAGLPLIGAVTAGPVVGAVLFALQKLIGGEIDKVAQSQYRLSGSWDEPVVEPVRREPAEKSYDILDDL